MTSSRVTVSRVVASKANLHASVQALIPAASYLGIDSHLGPGNALSAIRSCTPHRANRLVRRDRQQAGRRLGVMSTLARARMCGSHRSSECSRGPTAKRTAHEEAIIRLGAGHCAQFSGFEQHLVQCHQSLAGILGARERQTIAGLVRGVRSQPAFEVGS